MAAWVRQLGRLKPHSALLDIHNKLYLKVICQRFNSNKHFNVISLTFVFRSRLSLASLFMAKAHCGRREWPPLYLSIHPTTEKKHNHIRRRRVSTAAVPLLPPLRRPMSSSVVFASCRNSRGGLAAATQDTPSNHKQSLRSVSQVR